MAKTKIPKWMNVNAECSFDNNGEQQAGKIVKVDGKNMIVTVKPTGKPAVTLMVSQLDQIKTIPQATGKNGNLPKITVLNYKKEWEKRFPRLAYYSKRPKYNVIESLMKQKSVEIKIPAGAKGSAKVETVIINGQYFYVERGIAIEGPQQIKDMLTESGHLDGQELIMHTPEVRAQRGHASIGKPQDDDD